MHAQAVLDFWFLPVDCDGYGAPRVEWFRKSEQFDYVIRERFCSMIGMAKCGGLRDWDRAGPEGKLARIIVLDQFTRNAARDSAAAFEGDTLALEAAIALVASGTDRLLLPVQRWFAYLPFEHAESMAMQNRSVDLFGALYEDHPELAGAFDYALKHRAVIERFGRFPHRNAILGRTSTAAELAYLAQPGSGF